MATVYDTLKPQLQTKSGLTVPRSGQPVQNGGGIYPAAPGAPTTQGPPGVNAAQPGRPPGAPQPASAPGVLGQVVPFVQQGQPAPAQQGQQAQPLQQATPQGEQGGQQPLVAPEAQPQQPAPAPAKPTYGDYGEISESPTGGAGVTLSDQGKLKLAQAQMRALQRYGPHPGSNDPDAPKPIIVPGKPFYNPWTGQWGK